jgi:hypothetical protein
MACTAVMCPEILEQYTFIEESAGWLLALS